MSQEIVDYIDKLKEETIFQDIGPIHDLSRVIKNDDPGHSIDYISIVPYLLSSIQTLSAKIKQLEQP